jgi:hypothetical protein
MPFIDDVEQLLKDRIRADSPQQFSQAGTVWKELRLGFYYQDENVADIVAADIAVQAAALDQLKLSDTVLRLLQRDINLDTPVTNAINRIFVATFVPEPL